MVRFQEVHCCLSPVLQKPKKVRHLGVDMKNNVKHNIIKILQGKTLWAQIPHFIVTNAKLVYFDHEYDNYEKMLNEIKKEV